MSRVIKLLMLWVAGVTTVTSVAAAQTPPEAASVDLTAGYQFQRLGRVDGLNMPKGLFADVAVAAR